ncbi:N-formylglutamate amidohydrolase [bacterium]|nr:N-formylglutamate amidohydrolase [bacterium]
MARPRWSAAFAVPFLAVTGLPAQETPASPESPFVTAHKGNFPVILSAPHGGTEDVPGVPPRRGVGIPPGTNGFFPFRDVGTEELADAIAAAVEAKTGRVPFFVSAKFHRKYLDVNRPPEFAYEHAEAKPVYDCYRGTLAAYCKEVRKKYGRGLLLDVHAQGMMPGTVMRGTADGKTVALLRQRFGEKAHTGPDSFFGLLGKGGLAVFPARLDAAEDPMFNGGHIVRTYGGGDFGIDAIQLEFGWTLATPKAVPGTAKKVAAAVDRFHQLYLADPKK